MCVFTSFQIICHFGLSIAIEKEFTKKKWQTDCNSRRDKNLGVNLKKNLFYFCLPMKIIKDKDFVTN